MNSSHHRDTLGAVESVSIFLLCAAMLSMVMLPVAWSGNEINYFDLAFRQTRPDLFGSGHAAFDDSNGRFASFWIIGSVINLLGFEMAKTIFGLTCICLYALALASLARALFLGPLSLAVALSVYLAHQSLLGDEWLFGAIEAKVFAYICLILSLAAWLRARWSLGTAFAALATYFHFLVGGFWGVAGLFLVLLSTQDWRLTARQTIMFVGLILPIMGLLVFERFGTQVDMVGIPTSLSAIYAEYRAPHHVAPFAWGLSGFVTNWLPGVVGHLGLAVALFMMRKSFNDKEALALWAALLNAYILIAILLAFVDQNTHLLAPFYLFRPSGFILLISVLLLMRRLLNALEPEDVSRLQLPTFVLLAAFVLPVVAVQAARLAITLAGEPRLENAMTAPERDVLNWLRANTETDDVVIVEPIGRKDTLAEEMAFPAGLERLTPAGFYVNFKFVPTAPADMAEWYRRLRTRQAIFQGDCTTLDASTITYVIRRGVGRGPLEHCTRTTFQNDTFSILKRNSP